jgi:hypothetical protein
MEQNELASIDGPDMETGQNLVVDSSMSLEPRCERGSPAANLHWERMKRATGIWKFPNGQRKTGEIWGASETTSSGVR